MLQGGNALPGRSSVILSAFSRELTSWENKNQRVIRITISGLPNDEAFRAFREYVKSIRLGMAGQGEERYSGGEGRLDVTYREKSLYLATIIGYRPEYRVVEHSWDRVTVVYVGKGL